MKTIIKTQGNRAVVITQSGEIIHANLYVNARNGLDSADITNLSWKGKTMNGAEKWATKQLAA